MATEAHDRAEAYYARVRDKVDNRNMGVVKAIKAVAKEEKLSSATIQAYYYRVARERGTTRSAIAQDRRMQAKEFARAVTDQSPEAIMNDIFGAVRELVDKNRQLEEDRARLERIAEIFSSTDVAA